MNQIIVFLLIGSITLYLISKFFFKFNLLIEKVDKNIHKKFLISNDRKNYSGGFFLLLASIFVFFDQSIYFKICIILIYFVGTLSDIDLVSSPKIRLFIQLVIIILFTILTGVYVEETKVIFIDYLLNYKIIKLIFTIFCFMVLINGCNFIDGVNTLLVGYYLIVLGCIKFVSSYSNIFLDLNNINLLFCTLLILFFFNFFSKVLMGDSGAYFLGLIFGYFAINLSNNNLDISPIFILNLLWYPAFENLFSIIRKLKTKTSISKPDNLHLHHLVYKKINSKLFKFKYKNSLTGILINFVNLILLFISCIVAHHSIYLSIILILSMFIYLLTYYNLKKNI